MYKLIATSLGIFLISLFVIGCGGSGGSTTTSQVTQAQFLKQAKSICAKTKSEIKTQAVAWTKAHGGKELEWDAGLKQILGPLLKQQAAAFAALETPAHLEDKVDHMASNLSEGATNFIKEGEKGNADGFKKFQDEAESLGLVVCNL